MIIKSIRVRNFRCILDATLNCEPLTALVGPNGAGKSSFLRALELFYSTNPRFDSDDFYNNAIDRDIEISVTFKDLSKDAADKFAPYLEGNDLTVTRVLSLPQGRPTGKFYGSRLQNPDFLPIRQEAKANPAREKYAELKQRPEYEDLPPAPSHSAVLGAIKQWEEAHPEKSMRQRDDGQFFGFTQVGQGYLGQFTRFIKVPAVRDAAEEAAEGRGRLVTEIMDLVIRATLANREELTRLREEAQERYDEVMASISGKELEELQERLTKTLQTYVADASVKLTWETEGAVQISNPRADVQLVEDGYPSSVAGTGHGLQRAFILTMFQHLAAAQAELPEGEPQETDEGTTVEASGGEAAFRESVVGIPCLVLGIEEPELYQHPNRQRHLAKVLLRLADGSIAGVAQTTQVIYTTHSPLFVGIDRFDQVRVLRKISVGPVAPKITKVTEVKGDSVAEALWEACERKDRNGNLVPKFTWHTLKPRLQAVMTPWIGEGFFADMLVLVEGEDDHAAVIGTALAHGCDLEGLGISVIPCGSKSCLDRPYAIFTKFGIPAYVLWDGDKHKREPNPRENQILQRLLGAEVVDWPCGVHDRFACFENELEASVRAEIGKGLFDSLLDACQTEFGYSNKQDALKNPYVFCTILKKARDQGVECGTLDAMIDAILKLKSVGETAQ